MKKIVINIIQFIKRPLFRIKGTKIHSTTRVMSINGINRSTIGKYCYIGLRPVFNNTIIGNYCSIAHNVTIGGMEHSYWSHSMSTHISDENIMGRITRIGNDVWIGANCIIKQGVSIGDGAVIGAGSIVTKDVPENTIYVGVPAKFLKTRLDEKVWNKIKYSEYWNYSPKKAKILLSKIEIEK